MAVYKVPQDVEAEDKLLGPLTFKQFIFLLIAGGGAIFAWLLFSLHPALGLLPTPIILIFGGLAVFRREDQPVERYLLSFFNFTFRPKVRMWNTEGYYDHLIITAPRTKATPELKRNVSEVHGQLEKLAQIVDSRGWSAKQAVLLSPGGGTTTAHDDRLFVPATEPTEEPLDDQEDIMDDTNPEAKQLDTILEKQAVEHRQAILDKVRQQAANANSSPTPHYNPYPAGMTHQHQIDPSGGGTKKSNLKPEPVWTVMKDGNQVGSYNSEDEAYSAHLSQSGSVILDQNNHDITAQLIRQRQVAPAHPLEEEKSDILELSDQLKVSQIAEQVNRKSDQDLNEGEEIKLR